MRKIFLWVLLSRRNVLINLYHRVAVIYYVSFKKLDGNYTRMLQAILNKSRRQHPTKQQLYGHLPPITKTINIRRTRHAGHGWRSRDELIRDVLLWTPSHGRAKAGRPARTYMQQLCADTRCIPEDLLETMADREGWRERVRDIRADGVTWWWWLCFAYFNLKKTSTMKHASNKKKYNCIIFEMRLLNLRVNFLFIADFLSTSWYFFFICSFFFFFSLRFGQISPLAFFRWFLPRPRIGMMSLVTVFPVITAFHSCCLSYHVFDQKKFGTDPTIEDQIRIYKTKKSILGRPWGPVAQRIEALSLYWFQVNIVRR